MYILGYYASLRKLTKKEFTCKFIINFIITVTIFIMFEYKLDSLQLYKFPVSLPYFLISTFSVILIWYLKDIIKVKKSNIIVKIGSNAIFFYFAQGISSSLILLWVDNIIIKNIYIKLLVMFIINLSIALLIGFCLIYTYNFVIKVITKLKRSEKND